MSDKWTSLLKCPEERFSNPVFISSDEFVVAPYNYSKQKSEGILKYNTTANKWMTLVKYPKDFQVSNCSLSFDETERKLYLIGAESIIYVINLNNNKITKLSNGKFEAGVNPSSLFVEGTLHLIGGSRNKKHMIRNVYNEDDEKKSNTFKPIFEFSDWVKGSQNNGLIYVPSRSQFILLGGYNQFCEHKYSDMVYVYDLTQKSNKKKWIKKCKMPERSCYFGYVLSADEKYIILMGGYTNERKLVKKIYILDLDQMKFIKGPSFSAPASGSVRAIMSEDNNVYLFKHDSGNQWKINIQSLMIGYSGTDDNYAYQLVKKYKKLLKQSEMENRQNVIALNKQKQINESLVSKNKNKNKKGGDGNSLANKKLTKKVTELEEKLDSQQTEIQRLEEKLQKYKRYINELESEKMKANNSNLQQRLKIKELQGRLYELEGDSAELGDIEAFLKRQEKLAKEQEKQMAEIVADIGSGDDTQD